MDLEEVEEDIKMMMTNLQEDQEDQEEVEEVEEVEEDEEAEDTEMTLLTILKDKFLEALRRMTNTSSSSTVLTYLWVKLMERQQLC